MSPAKTALAVTLRFSKMHRKTPSTPHQDTGHRDTMSASYPHPKGDPEHHLSWQRLTEAFAALPSPAAAAGTVRCLVRRCPDGQRELPQSVTLTVHDGMPGDRWGTGRRSRSNQLTVMRADVGALVANGQSPGLFGDNLHVDLDLSMDNLPAGTRLRIGAAEVEVTDKPHDGCSLYRQRFGADALKLTAHPDHKAMRLRGLHVMVVQDGLVQVGDAITVLHRPAPQPS